jgi:hypothetical protein
MTGQLFTVPAKLTENQSLILELGRELGKIDALTAGIELHAAKGCRHCAFYTPHGVIPCQYAASQGRQVLEALRKKGLLRRDRHHIYRRTDSTTSIAPDEPVDWGGY